MGWEGNRKYDMVFRLQKWVCKGVVNLCQRSTDGLKKGRQTAVRGS